MRLSVLYMCLVVAGALWRQLAQSGAIVFLYVSVFAHVCLLMAGALWWQFPQSGAMVRLDGAWIRQGPNANQL